MKCILMQVQIISDINNWMVTIKQKHSLFQICREVSNVNNGTGLIKFVDKKHLIIQSYTQLFFKAATNSHRLRNSCARLLRGELHSNSPRLWNLYLALSKELTATKIEL